MYERCYIADGCDADEACRYLCPAVRSETRMSGDDAFRAAARRYFRKHAEAIERAADAIGANDTRLANRLYDDAGRVRVFADTFQTDESPDPR